MWKFLVRNKKCDGQEENWKRYNKGHLPSVDHCAAACLGMSKWFIYGKSDNGNDKCTQGCCSGQGCQCICQGGRVMKEEKGLSCDLKENYGYDVYELPGSAGLPSFYDLILIFILII